MSPCAAAQRDLLVQQLLEERRQRLQQQLYGADVRDQSRQGKELSRDQRSSSAPSRLRGGVREDFDRDEKVEEERAATNLLFAALEGWHRDSDGASSKDEGGGTGSAGGRQDARGDLGGLSDSQVHDPAEARDFTFGTPDRGLVGEMSSPRRSPSWQRSPSAPSSLRASSAPFKPPQRVKRNFGEKLEEWQLRQRAVVSRQQQQRQEKESEEMEECTFTPSINNKSEYYARRSRGCLFEPLVDRLHHEADKRSTLRQRAKELLEADAMCDYTFKPQINRSHSSEGARTALHLRQQRKVVSEKKTDTQCSFTPAISEKSQRIVQKKRDRLYRSLSKGDTSCVKKLGPVEERLYADAQALEQKRLQFQEMSSMEPPQMPEMDEESRRICSNSVYFKGPQQDFLTRQQTFELAKMRRMEVRTQHAEAKCSFRPAISDTSRQIVSTNFDYMGESLEDRVQRLAVRDVERREQVRGALENMQYQDCTFRPVLNPMTQVIVSQNHEKKSVDIDTPSCVHERLYRTANKQRSVNDGSTEYTFKPDADLRANRRYSHVRSHYDCKEELMENIRHDLVRKEEMIEERRRQLAEEETAECTFVPGTKPTFENPRPAPAVVSGLGRFFQLKEMAQRQREEQRVRENKVFRPEQASKSRYGGVTIPEPFGLTDQRDNSRSKHGLDADRQGECTFVPRTNEAVNREVLQKILRSS